MGFRAYQGLRNSNREPCNSMGSFSGLDSEGLIQFRAGKASSGLKAEEIRS